MLGLLLAGHLRLALLDNLAHLAHGLDDLAGKHRGRLRARRMRVAALGLHAELEHRGAGEVVDAEAVGEAAAEAGAGEVVAGAQPAGAELPGLRLGKERVAEQRRVLAVLGTVDKAQAGEVAVDALAERVLAGLVRVRVRGGGEQLVELRGGLVLAHTAHKVVGLVGEGADHVGAAVAEEAGTGRLVGGALAAGGAGKRELERHLQVGVGRLASDALDPLGAVLVVPERGDVRLGGDLQHRLLRGTQRILRGVVRGPVQLGPGGRRVQLGHAVEVLRERLARRRHGLVQRVVAEERGDQRVHGRVLAHHAGLPVGLHNQGERLVEEAVVAEAAAARRVECERIQKARRTAVLRLATALGQAQHVGVERQDKQARLDRGEVVPVLLAEHEQVLTRLGPRIAVVRREQADRHAVVLARVRDDVPQGGLDRGERQDVLPVVQHGQLVDVVPAEHRDVARRVGACCVGVVVARQLRQTRHTEHVPVLVHAEGAHARRVRLQVLAVHLELEVEHAVEQPGGAAHAPLHVVPVLHLVRLGRAGGRIAQVPGDLGRHALVRLEHDPPVAVDQQRRAPLVVRLLDPEPVVEPVVRRRVVHVHQAVVEPLSQPALEELSRPLLTLLELCGRGALAELAKLLRLPEDRLHAAQVPAHGLLDVRHRQARQPLLRIERVRLRVRAPRGRHLKCNGHRTVQRTDRRGYKAADT